jgi:hypothetical protein
MSKASAIRKGKMSRISKLLIVTLICALLIGVTIFTAFADTYTGYINGLPYKYWFLRERTSQDYPCISTTFDYPTYHYSSAATYVGSQRKHYSGRDIKYDSTTSRAYSTYEDYFAYTSAYYGTEP